MKFLVVVGVFCLLLALPPFAGAQIPADFDFGVRGGVFTGGVSLEAPNNRYFPDIYTVDQPQFPTTLGPAVGVLLNHHWYVRLEAARSRFRFHYERGTNFDFPFNSFPEITSVTDGHAWQFPLLLSYMAGKGKLRPFGGGGVSFGTTFTGTTRTTTTTLVGPPPAPGATGPFPTMSTTTSAPFDTRFYVTPSAFYITGGLEVRVSRFSIRPELRYAHWLGISTTDINSQVNTILYPQSQMEFLLTVSVHPFRKREH